MESNIFYLVFYIISVLVLTSNGRLVIDENTPNRLFDNDLYERVLDSESCLRQVEYMRNNDTMLGARFIDAGIRLPRSAFLFSNTDLGNYPQCLRIQEKILDMNIQGKYCFLSIPLNQTFLNQFDDERNMYLRTLKSDLSNKRIVHFNNGIIPGAQSFAIPQRDDMNRAFDLDDIVKVAVVKLGVCIPQSCTTEEWALHNYVNLSSIGFEFEEQFCRLPNDKPWVPVDYVAIAIFSLFGLVTLVGTLYDVTHQIILKKDPKSANTYIKMFSFYTNTKRLVTFTPNSNALDCLDGIRGISMMWVLIGHAFPMHNFFINFRDALDFLTSGDGVWVNTGLFAVDSFLLMAGLLLVYTTVGKVSGPSFLKRVHIFYLHRLLRMFPLLAALVLLEASVFHRMVDGPYWVEVANNAQNCRTFWWSTLLHIQNYVNPDHLCIQHSWYIAIDIQLHIVSPIILFWVLGKNKKAAWSALVTALLALLIASTIWNFIMEMPSTTMSIVRINEQSYYMKNYYMNAMTRGSPFIVGMMAGYVLNIYKGKEIKLNTGFMLTSWLISLGLIASCFYTSYVVMQLDWDNQVGDSLFNSFMRPIWAVGLSWLIFACVKGYGGPINWLLSLSLWKIPARISYAMYLYHYPIMFLAAGMQVQAQYFSQGTGMFDFMAFLVITLWVAYVVTVVIDAPCTMIIKMVMEAGQRKRRPLLEKNAGPPKTGEPLPEKDISMLENNIMTTLEKNDHDLHKNGTILENSVHSLQRNGSIVDNNNVSSEKNRVIDKNSLFIENNVTNLDRQVNYNEPLVKIEAVGDVPTNKENSRI